MKRTAPVLAGTGFAVIGHASARELKSGSAQL